MTLKYEIKNQVLHPVGRIPPTVELSRNVVFLELFFDAEWSGAAVTVLFENSNMQDRQIPVLWTGEPVSVPPEVLVTGDLRIGCIGLKEDGTRLTTARMLRGIYVCVSGGAMLLAEGAAETTPALWEQVLAAMGQLGDLKTDDKSSLVAAINEVLSKVGTGEGGAIDPDQIAQAVEDYLEANPPAQGAPGTPGQAATLQITGAVALEAGAAPTVTEQPGSTAQDRIYSLGIPSGKDGAPGKDGDPGQQGEKGAAGGYYAPYVTQPDANTMRVSFAPSDTSMPAIQVQDIALPQGPEGKQGETGPQGEAGPAGYTPVRGTDYWTTEDQQAIVSDVLAALPTWEGGSY